ncbi:type 11 methyltransferase [Candidatus Magnetobacterium bavaricum]|uniref:Type 11 methyltransferase n=1 Tax=Candidatus Magnetobacterium bavaricum TaxID=29290 RepID=A0A0F3GL79_9BACT|nr:type 11 methyltransferase [Candidatus Magnetobacterium bavaricum]
MEDEHGLKVWLDKWNIVDGDSLYDARSKGLEESKTCAVCIGEKPPGGWLEEEIAVVLSMRLKDTSFRVIPVLLPRAKPDNIPGFLKSRSGVDFSKGIDYGDEMYRLVCGIQGIPPEPVEIKKSKFHKRLSELKEFTTRGLISEEVYIEAQRKILDRWIGF